MSLISRETPLPHLKPSYQFLKSSFPNAFATDNFVTALCAQKKSKWLMSLGAPGHQVPAGWSLARAGAAP